MFYRYLRCLVDDDAGIRQLVQVSLKAILSKNVSNGPSSAGGVQATRIHMHFVELIFFLNQCHEHPLYNQFRGGVKGSKTGSKDAPFGLVGALGTPNAQKRFTLYRYCLSLLTDEQKFILMGKLHSEVLQAVNEESFLTTPWHTGLRTADVVQDALLILASEAMQLGAGAKKAADVESVEGELQELALASEETESAPKSAASLATMHAQQAAKTKLLHKLLKKSTMDACLPVLFELRMSFARAHSPLAEWLHFYFSELLQHYKAEMSEIFAGNKMLEREVLYDLKRWSETDEHQAQQERWRQMDFTPKKKLEPTAVAPDSVSRRLSLGAAVAATPVKSSSLAALRVAATPMSAVRLAMASPALRRTLSTPSATAAAATHVQATPSTLRTPGPITTPVLRRTISTPSSAARVTTKPRRSGAPVTPARLVEGVEDDDADDADTDVEEDEENRPANIVLPSPDGGKLRTSGLWNVALRDADAEPQAEEVEEPIRVQPSKKARTESKPPANALEKLTIAKQPTKRKHVSTPVKREEDTNMDTTSSSTEAAAAAAAASRPKRKATAGLR
jgi:hypothetical protein